MINLDKSEVCFSKNTPADKHVDFCNVLRIPQVTSHSRYLGLPLIMGQRKTEAFRGILDKMWRKVNDWRCKLLSAGGREVLIKAVLQAMPVYMMSVYYVPRKIIGEMYKLISQYWWDKEEGKGISWVSKGILQKNKCDGGLGFKDLYAFNDVMLMKVGWRMMKFPGLLMSQILTAKYCKGRSIFEARLGSNPSSVWRGVMKSLKMLLDGVWWDDRGATFMWKHTSSGSFTVRSAYDVIKRNADLLKPDLGEQSDKSFVRCQSTGIGRISTSLICIGLGSSATATPRLMSKTIRDQNPFRLNKDVKLYDISELLVRELIFFFAQESTRSRHTTPFMAVKPFEKPLHILIEEKFISLLQSCATLKHLHQIHTQVIAHGMHHSEYVAPRLVSACAQLNHMPLAGRIFHQISYPNIMLCNAMLRGYLQNDLCEDVLRLFGYMKTTATVPNCFTYPVVLRSCIKISALKEGEQVYSDLTKMGFKSNSYVGTTLIDMYSKWKLTKYAHKVFTEMLEKNVVAWTSMIRGYLSVGNMDFARSLFNLAPERDVVLWNIMISGYIETGDMASAQHLFDRFPNRDVMSWNTMLNGYSTWGNIAACEKLFDEMPARNVLSWNGLIGAYVHNRLHSKVLISFKQMLSESDVLPNDATLVTVLSACSKLGALDLGKWVHVYAENNFLGMNVYVQNALIDMYAKCGVVESALGVFNIWPIGHGSTLEFSRSADPVQRLTRLTLHGM
ncbi:hypothetical protein QQ045_023348 [Rhodiola kirilowii]